ncbi:MAG: hypothetical protein HLX50_14410 [Alteromonadaceae bacterium]|nr:hypothetical protein [Alteromonadaceae bacterium]
MAISVQIPAYPHIGILISFFYIAKNAIYTDIFTLSAEALALKPLILEESVRETQSFPFD